MRRPKEDLLDFSGWELRSRWSSRLWGSLEGPWNYIQECFLVKSNFRGQWTTEWFQGPLVGILGSLLRYVYWSKDHPKRCPGMSRHYLQLEQTQNNHFPQNATQELARYPTLWVHWWLLFHWTFTDPLNLHTSQNVISRPFWHIPNLILFVSNPFSHHNISIQLTEPFDSSHGIFWASKVRFDSSKEN